MSNSAIAAVMISLFMTVTIVFAFLLISPSYERIDYINEQQKPFQTTVLSSYSESTGIASSTVRCVIDIGDGKGRVTIDFGIARDCLYTQGDIVTVKKIYLDEDRYKVVFVGQ